MAGDEQGTVFPLIEIEREAYLCALNRTRDDAFRFYRETVVQATKVDYRRKFTFNKVLTTHHIVDLTIDALVLKQKVRISVHLVVDGPNPE
jgi:hypothetical protein